MIQYFVRKQPQTKLPANGLSRTLQKVSREIQRIVRKFPKDRRDPFRNRRSYEEQDVFVNLSNSPEKRKKPDRRRRQELFFDTVRTKDRRRPPDEGILVDLSNDRRRKGISDRRKYPLRTANTPSQKAITSNEVKECIDNMNDLIKKLKKYV